MSPSNSSESLPFPGSEFQEIEGIRLHLRRWPPRARPAAGRALLIHGFGGSTFSWRLIGPGLSEMGFDTVAVDLPGFGYSSRLSLGEPRDRPWGDLIWELLDRLEAADGGEAAWVLAGHSIGARVAVSMAVEQPERTSRIVLIAAELYGAPTALPFLGLPPVRWFVARWLATHALTERGVERLLQSAYGRRPTSEEVRGYLTPLLLPGTIIDLLQLREALPEVSVGDLERIEQPTLIVWGEEDAWTDVKNALRIFNDLPAGEVFTIRGAGHLPIETHPEMLIRRLNDFLRSP